MNLVEDDNKEFVKDYFADFKIAMIDGVNFQDLKFRGGFRNCQSARSVPFLSIAIQVGVNHVVIWRMSCLSKRNVRNFMNANFVCVKYDLEKGKVPCWGKIWNTVISNFFTCGARWKSSSQDRGGTDSESFVALVKEGLDDNYGVGEFDEKI